MLTLEEKRLRKNEKQKLYMREYRKTEIGYKKSMITKWKSSSNLIGDYDKIFERFMSTTHCDLCNTLLTKERKGGRVKQMEHNHSNGEFRNIVCHICNSQKTDRKKQTNNTSGYKGIIYNKKRNSWVYRIQSKDKKVIRARVNKIEILCIKFAYMILYRK